MEWNRIENLDEETIDFLHRLDEKKNAIALARPIPSIALVKIKDALSVEWTYNSNAMEGNTLSLNETKLVLEEGITVKGKSLIEHFETINHSEAIEHIYKLASPNYVLRERDILDTHSLVLNKIEADFAGRFRNAGVRITGANFLPPNALKIDTLFTELINWINNDSQYLHPIAAATIFHHRFVWIHPFFDGNGRTVRLIFNLLLMKHGYPPAIILKNDRKKYYDALNKANNGDYSKLLLLVAQAMQRSLNIYLSNIDTTYDFEPIINIVSEPDIPYGMEYVSLLARQGKIDAHKEGRVWYTSKEALKSYEEKRQRKRVLKDK
jgi:Fic family protein